MITIFSEDHRLQDGKAELIDGKLVPCFEMPRRAEIVRARVAEVGLGDIEPPLHFGREPILRVHKPEFVGFLETAWDEWTREHGDYDALPLNWLAPGMRRKLPERIDGKMGYFSFDAGTPITAGTWRAITASANVALTGQARVAKGERAVFSLCRPPGHHAGHDFYGGYCFLNNAAIAAQAFRDAGAARVAVLDVDYHHGNGTQDIFYARSDVGFVSIHADPSTDYPYFWGHADERGFGDGLGANLNLPLPQGTGWESYTRALDQAAAAIASWGARFLVVSFGADTFEEDPISYFRLGAADYPALGARIAAIGLPTVIVMEGGYAVDALGANVAAFLASF